MDPVNIWQIKSQWANVYSVVPFVGHTARVLHMAMSPDGSTVVSAAADETLRLWKCFAVDPTKKKASTASMLSSAPKTMMRGGIR